MYPWANNSEWSNWPMKDWLSSTQDLSLDSHATPLNAIEGQEKISCFFPSSSLAPVKGEDKLLPTTKSNLVGRQKFALSLSLSYTDLFRDKAYGLQDHRLSWRKLKGAVTHHRFCCFLSSVFDKVVATTGTDSWLVPISVHVSAGRVLAFPSTTRGCQSQILYRKLKCFILF